MHDAGDVSCNVTSSEEETDSKKGAAESVSLKGNINFPYNYHMQIYEAANIGRLSHE